MISFASPLILYALGFLIVPVLLHIMKRELAKPLVFPTIRFLSKGRLPKEGKRRLRDIILLFIRMAIFTLIVLFFAKPFIIPQTAVEEVQNRNKVLIFIDSSASMGVSAVMEKAKKHLDTILESHEDCQFLLFSAPAQVKTEFTEDKEEIRKAFSKLAAGYEPLPLTTVINEIKNLAGSAENTLYFLSDFQSSPWQELNNFNLPANIDLKLLDCQVPGLRNLGITAVDVIKESAGNFLIDVTVRNYSASTEKTTITIKSGKEETKRNITVSSGESIHSVINLKSSSPEALITLDNDDLTADNSRYVYLVGKSPAQLLAFAPPKRTEAAGELFFMDKALKVTRQGRPKLFNLSLQPRTKLATADLSKFQAVILTALDLDIQDKQLQKIKKYVENGGVLISTPRTGSGNMYLKMKKEGLLNANFAGQYSASGTLSPAYVSEISSTSDLNEIFNEEVRPDLFSQPITRYLKLKTKAENVLLSSTNSDPLLIEEKIGKGFHYVFTFSLDPQQSELPLSFSFLPLIREILKPASKSSTRPVKIVECGTKLNEATTSRPGLITNNGEKTEIIFPTLESQTDYLPLSEIRSRLTSSDINQKLQKRSEKQKKQDLSIWALLSAIIFIFAYLAVTGFYDRKETEAMN